MKHLGILFYFLCTVFIAKSQTGIGTTTPDASAKLEVSATNKGFLPPRVTLTSGTDNTTIPNPATGLLVYNTGNNAGLVAGYYYWNGTSWATIATASGYSVGSSFMRGSRSAAQTTNLTTNSLVAFTQVDNVSGQEITLNTSTGQITLAAGRTYRLTAQVPNIAGGTRPAFTWYNETTGSWVGSQSAAYSPGDAANYIAFGGISEAIITANTTTVVSYRISSGSSLGNLGGSADFSTAGAYPWFDVQVISGNAAVNGQSVDYVSVFRTTSQTVNTGDNILFNSTNAGNIPYNSATGNFTLTAGKTYRLMGSVSLDASTSASSEIDIAWKNAAGDILGNRALMLSANFASPAGGNGISEIIYTPTVNTTIALNVIAATASAKTIPNYTYANIEQIGSSAIVNPWVLAGTNTYNTTGNVGIGTNNPTSLLNIAGGGVKLASGFGNSINRPSLNTSIIGNYEIRGVGSISGNAQNDLADDGFLRLSAGGGTSVNSQSSIDISGFSTVTDMSNNIVMRTNGTERLRIDNSGNVNVTGKINVTDPTGNLVTKASGIINTGSFVQLDNVKAGPTRNGAGGSLAGLSIAAVSASFVADISATYSNNTMGGTSATGVTYTTTAANSAFGWGFSQGNQSTYILNDTTNSRVYRITLMIGANFNNNFISIERIY